MNQSKQAAGHEPECVGCRQQLSDGGPRGEKAMTEVVQPNQCTCPEHSMAVEVAHVTCPVHGVSAQSKQERQLTREEMLRKLSEDWLEVGTTGNGLRPDSNIPAVLGVYEYCGDMLRQYLDYRSPEHPIAPTKEQRSELLELANKRIQELSVKLEQHAASLAKAREEALVRAAKNCLWMFDIPGETKQQIADYVAELEAALRLTAPGRSGE
jgi:hypothetical protein